MTLNLPLLKELDAKRTKGPWRKLERGLSDCILGAPTPEVDPSVVTLAVGCFDAAFIVALENQWLALLARLEASEAACRAADRLSDNIAEFDYITDNCFMERVDEALETWRRLVGDQT